MILRELKNYSDKKYKIDKVYKIFQKILNICAILIVSIMGINLFIFISGGRDIPPIFFITLIIVTCALKGLLYSLRNILYVYYDIEVEEDRCEDFMDFF